MPATLSVCPSAAASVAAGAGASRMTTRCVLSVLITPVAISVAPTAKTARPPTMPETRLDAAVVRLGPLGGRRGLGVRTGISDANCRASPGGPLRAVLHLRLSPAADADCGARRGRAAAPR